MAPVRISVLLMALLFGCAVASRTEQHIHRSHRSDHSKVPYDHETFMGTRASQLSVLSSDKGDADDEADKDDGKDDDKDDDQEADDSDKKADKDDDKDDDQEADDSDTKAERKVDKAKLNLRNDDEKEKKDAKDEEHDEKHEVEKKEESEEEEKKEKAEKKEKHVSKAETDLEAAMKYRATLQHSVDNLGDNVAFEAMLNQDIKQVSNETQSKHLANFLGGMWREMRMFGSPPYVEHLEKKIKGLDGKIATLEKKVESEDDNKAKEDDDEDDDEPEKKDKAPEEKDAPKKKKAEDDDEPEKKDKAPEEKEKPKKKKAEAKAVPEDEKDPLPKEGEGPPVMYLIVGVLIVIVCFVVSKMVASRAKPLHPDRSFA